MELIQSLTTVMDKQLYTRYTKCYRTGIMQKEVPPPFCGNIINLVKHISKIEKDFHVIIVVS